MDEHKWTDEGVAATVARALASERERCAGLVEEEAGRYFSGSPVRQDLLRLLEKIRRG